MTRNLKITLVVLFLFQVFISSTFNLAHDEAYYWLYSKNLAWGYFDHPPFVGVIIRLFSFLPLTEWGVRFGFIALQFGALGMMFKLIPKDRWMLATLLFFSFPLASLTGLFALPDMPLLFMSVAYVLALREYLEKPSAKSTVVLGLVIPILLYAKYHGILLVFFTMLAIPKLLLRKDFYLVTLISLLVFAPHFLWQYEHDFSTLRYHFLERPTSSFSVKRIVEYLGLQLFLPGLFIGPLVWWFSLKHQSVSAFERALKFMACGIVIFFLISTFSKKFEANWTIPVLVPLLYLSVRAEWCQIKRIMLYASFSVVLLSRIVLALPDGMVTIKRTGEFKGWREWSEKVRDLCGEKFLMANSYQIAAKLSFYLDREVPALNYHSRKNQFDYWKFETRAPSDEVCYITDKREFTGVPIQTPEGKNLSIVTTYKLSELLKMKEDQKSQNKR